MAQPPFFRPTPYTLWSVPNGPLHIVPRVHVFQYFLCFHPDPPKLPAMDLTFAISSAASQSVDTFNRMKQILRYIYDEYGYTTTRFSVIVFADTARTLLRFDENARVYDKKMVALINGLPRYRGRSDLNAALVEANRGFDNSGRPDSKKVMFYVLWTRQRHI